MHRVRVAREVRDFIGGLSPATRRLVRIANARFARGQWQDTREWPDFHRRLEGNLAGLGRVRAGRIRLIYLETSDNEGPVKVFFHAGWRATVYEALESLIATDTIWRLRKQGDPEDPSA
jgi:mRNA-degrading endonuclease RelE of RelBE toxin-antitoxin system